MTASPTRPPIAKQVLTSGMGLLTTSVAVMWLVEIVDSLILGSRLQNGGIQPRSIDGLDGILWSPLLHLDFAHLISNTLPFLVLGGLIAMQGLGKWVKATLLIMVIGGILTWAFASNSNHIGASGVVLGYFGYLVGAAIFERRFALLVPAAIAVILYGGIVASFVPRAGISWEGHLFGATAGLTAAWIIRTKRQPSLAA